MAYTHVKRILSVIFVINLFPIFALAQTAETSVLANDACTSAINGALTMVKPHYASGAVNPGEVLDIPVTLTNTTKTPLTDVHLLTRVTRLGASSGVVYMHYDPKPYALAPDASASTSVAWPVGKMEVAGNYRVDIFSLPSATYVNSNVLVDAPLSSSLVVLVLGKNKASPLRIVTEKTLLGGYPYRTANPVYFDEGEKGEASFLIKNSSATALSAALRWKVYSDQQVDDTALFFSASSTIKVPANGAVTVKFPIAEKVAKRYLATLEIEEGGRTIMAPMSFNRITKGPVSVGLLGIQPAKRTTGAFDLRKGETYMVFVCTSGSSMLAPTTFDIEIQDHKGKRILAQNVVHALGQPALPFAFSFVAPEYLPDAQVLLQTSAGGVEEKRSLVLSCGKEKTGACAPLLSNALPERRSMQYLTYALIGILVLVLAFLIGKHVHKKRLV